MRAASDHPSRAWPRSRPATRAPRRMTRDDQGVIRADVDRIDLIEGPINEREASGASKSRSRVKGGAEAYPAGSVPSVKPAEAGGPVEVMIAVPLVLPEQALTLGELAGRVEAWGRHVMRQGLVAAWAAQAQLRPMGAWPARAVAASDPAGRKARCVETVFGPVTLPRQRRRCRACGRHYQPDDAVLRADLGTGRLSPQLRELAVLCGASWPYREAATVLGGSASSRPPSPLSPYRLFAASVAR